MNVLGISSARLQHDPAACLVQDGKVIAFAEEERFNRIKHCGYLNEIHQFPYEAMDFCLKYAHFSMKDIDFLAIDYDPKAISFWKDLTTHKKAGMKIGPKDCFNIMLNKRLQ